MPRPFNGSLFAQGILHEAIAELADWKELSESAVDDLQAALQTQIDRFPTDFTPNESRPEENLISPVLAQLGWTNYLRQKNLSPTGRQDVPDGLQFAESGAKDQAIRLAAEWNRYALGLAIVESKQWNRPLNRHSGRRGQESAPSSKMLRYLRCVDDVTKGKVRWGFLMNSACWRLYWSGVRSVSEEYLEVNLAAVLGAAANNTGFTASGGCHCGCLQHARPAGPSGGVSGSGGRCFKATTPGCVLPVLRGLHLPSHSASGQGVSSCWWTHDAH